MAAKEAVKTQLKVTKGNEKKSLIVVLPYKKTFIGSTKTVAFAEHIEIVAKEKGSEMITTRTRKIQLPQRFRTL